MKRAAFETQPKMTATVLFVVLSLAACSTPMRLTHSLPNPSPSPTATPSEVLGITNTWIFDGPLQLMIIFRALPYSPGNYRLKSGDVLYQAVMEADDLYDNRELKLSARFELQSGSKILDATDELRGFAGNTIIGKTLMVKPFAPAHFSVLFQAPKGVQPQALRATFSGAAIRPIALRINVPLSH